MSTLTRGEKIDRAFETAKCWFIRTFLVIWALLTLSLGLGYVVSNHRVAELEKKVEYYEEIESKSIKVSDEDMIYIWHR